MIAVWDFKFPYYLRHHYGGYHCVVGGVNKVMWHSLRVLAAVSRSCCSYKRHVLLLLPLLVEISFRLLWSTLSITFLMCSSEEGTDMVGMLWGKNMGLLNLLRLFVPLLHYTWPWKLQFDQPQKKRFCPIFTPCHVQLLLLQNQFTFLSGECGGGWLSGDKRVGHVWFQQSRAWVVGSKPPSLPLDDLCVTHTSTTTTPSCLNLTFPCTPENSLAHVALGKIKTCCLRKAEDKMLASQGYSCFI